MIFSKGPIIKNEMIKQRLGKIIDETNRRVLCFHEKEINELMLLVLPAKKGKSCFYSSLFSCK